MNEVSEEDVLFQRSNRLEFLELWGLREYSSLGSFNPFNIAFLDSGYLFEPLWPDGFCYRLASRYISKWSWLPSNFFRSFLPSRAASPRLPLLTASGFIFVIPRTSHNTCTHFQIFDHTIKVQSNSLLIVVRVLFDLQSTLLEDRNVVTPTWVWKVDNLVTWEVLA